MLPVFTFTSRGSHAPRMQANRNFALGTAGLQVTFALLCRPELVRAPYREIAHAAGVELGSITHVMRGFEARGFLTGNQPRRILDPSRLLEEWVTHYPIALRPKLHPSRFEALGEGIVDADLKSLGAYWGAELAAQRLTQLLKPAAFTIYTNKPVKKVVVALRRRANPGANGAGTGLSHQRLNPSATAPYDFYFVDQFTVQASASVPLDLNLDTFYLGANGKTGVLVGLDAPYSFEFWVAAQPLSPSGSVYLNPLGIANVASYDPVTSPVAPGEFLILTGTNLASSASISSSLPLTTTLGSTGVIINGYPAPLYYVSPTQIDLIVPFEIAPSSLAQIIVTNTGTASNPVTVRERYRARHVHCRRGRHWARLHYAPEWIFGHCGKSGANRRIRGALRQRARRRHACDRRRFGGAHRAAQLYRQPDRSHHRRRTRHQHRIRWARAVLLRSLPDQFCDSHGRATGRMVLRSFHQ